MKQVINYLNIYNTKLENKEKFFIIPYIKINFNLCRLFYNYNFIQNYFKLEYKKKIYIIILMNNNITSNLNKFKIYITKKKQIYIKKNELQSYINKYSFICLNTSKGFSSGDMALINKVGGILICSYL